MPAIPRAWVQRYSDMLNSISERGRAELARVLAKVDLNADPDEVRAMVVEVMQRACGASAVVASALAAQFYDGLRERMAGERMGAAPDGGRVPEATAGAVHAFVTEFEKDGDAAALVRVCKDRLDREVRLAANETVRRNADRDPRKPRYARVPTGPETCPFCIMLASRGFVYRDEELASHAHANCDCRVIPSWDKRGREAIEGYDPEYYLDCYRHPEDHPELKEARNARRRELRAERKAAALAEAERRRVGDLSDEACRVFASDGFVKTFGHSVASDAEAAIDGAMKSGDRARANAARLLSRDIAEGFDVSSLTADRSRYLPGSGAVQFTPDGAQSVRVIAHELAHKRDFKSALSYLARRLTVSGETDVSLATYAGGWSSMEFEHGNRTLASRFRVDGTGETPAWRDLKRRLGAKSDKEAEKKLHELRREAGLTQAEAKSLSDIVHAASDGRVCFLHGHFPDEDGTYWNDMTRTIEVFADYSASLVVSSRESRLIRELFPDEAAIMDAMMEEMI